jgi:hypothetical protein
MDDPIVEARVTRLWRQMMQGKARFRMVTS